MTGVAGARAAPLAPSRPRVSLGLAGQIVLLVLLAAALAAPAVGLVWRGGFADPDDALRLAEVRAWLAGQSWFDVTAYRLDPPHGASMHWSRLVDVPNALLIELFARLAPGRAEALDAIVLPLACLAGLGLGLARLATLLLGPSARPVAIFGLLLCSATMAQVQPGHIGHHAPETLLLVWAVYAALAAFDAHRAGAAAIAGLLVALALAISLETLPLLATLCGLMVLVWVRRGAPMAPALASFGAGLALGVAALFLLTVPPARWMAPTGDALGRGHVCAALLGGVGVVGLAAARDRLATRGRRLAATLALGVVLAAAVARVAPEVLRGPFAQVDPLVRSIWLDHVVESKSLPEIARQAPMLALALFAPTALGCLALVTGAVRAARVRRDEIGVLRLAALAGLVLVGLALGIWQVRAFASVGPLAVCGGLLAVESVRRRAASPASKVLAPAVLLPFTVLGWALVLPADPAPTSTSAHACLRPDALAPLATLAAGRAVAPLQVGSHLVATTALDPFAGPYHRNNDGNRFALDVWAAPPAVAARLLEDRNVRYVLVCTGEGDPAAVAARAPAGLAAALLRGDPPAFLSPVPLPAPTPYRVYEMHAGDAGRFRVR